MFALLAVALLLIAAVAILAIRIWRPGFGYSWLLAALGSLAAWGLALAAGPLSPKKFAPYIFAPFTWLPNALIPASPVLILDSISWPFVLAVAAISVAVVLADVHRIAPGEGQRATRGDLAAGLCLAAVAALATTAGNLLTLLLLWAGLDLALLLIWIGRAHCDDDVEASVVALTVRLASHLLLVWASLSASEAGISTSLAPVAAPIAPYLITAAGLRLGLLPPHRPVPWNNSLSPALNSLAWLAPAASALTLMERAARAGIPTGSTWYLLFGAGAILYAGWSWINARSAQPGLPYYILGYAALALAGTARGLAFVGMSWGLAGLLAGGVIALLGPRTRAPALPLMIAGLFSAGLPLTPTWSGASLFAWPFPLITLVYLLGLGLLLAGYMRLALRPSLPLPAAERWVWLIYPLGLAFLPVTQAGIIVLLRPGVPGGVERWPGALASGVSLVAVGVAVFGAALLQNRRKGARRRRPAMSNERILPALEWTWMYRAGWALYRRLSRALEIVTWALEGRAGFLWALLTLALLLSLLAQLGLGG